MSDVTDLSAARCKLNEGFRSSSYLDSRGKLTIGYGFCIDEGISEYAASKLLEAQLDELEVDLDPYPWYRAAASDPIRQSVLLELSFNLGLTGLLGFHDTLAACERGDWGAAAQHLQDSKWFTQVSRRGPLLVRLLRDGGLT